MPTTHIVQQGEHLPGIAAKYGFGHFESLWNAPENAILKAKRLDPNVLLPGDEIVIPDRETKLLSVATGVPHRFVVRRSPVYVRLRLLDNFGKPRSGQSCELNVDGKRQTLTSDGDGFVQCPMPPSAESATLKVDGVAYDVRIGHLDPINTNSGLGARLNNLGYYVGEVQDKDIDPDLLAFAIKAFEADQGLPITGKVTPLVLLKITELHGS